jgi:hypothetical protein
VVDALGGVVGGVVGAMADVVGSLFTVEGCTLSAGTVGCDELLEPLHEDASNATTTPAAAILGVMRMTNSVLGSLL